MKLPQPAHLKSVKRAAQLNEMNKRATDASQRERIAFRAYYRCRISLHFVRSPDRRALGRPIHTQIPILTPLPLPIRFRIMLSIAAASPLVSAYLVPTPVPRAAAPKMAFIDTL